MQIEGFPKTALPLFSISWLHILPPMRSAASRITKSAIPAFCRSLAAPSPAIPAPMITTLKSVEAILVFCSAHIYQDTQYSHVLLLSMRKHGGHRYCTTNIDRMSLANDQCPKRRTERIVLSADASLVEREQYFYLYDLFHH